MGLAACGDLARLVTPSGEGDARPARVSMTATIATASSARADEVITLRVTSEYLRADGTRTLVGSQNIALGAAPTQALPIPVDLAGCLADGTRAGASGDAVCSVVLELALRVNDVVVDRQSVGPLRLAPGATTTVSQPVTLFEIAALDVAPAAPAAMIIGTTTTLTAAIRDARGQAVTGREVVWTSDAPTIASVDATGRVTALAAGTARVTATLGAITSSVAVQVSRAPVALSVSAAPGSGNGVVRSVPAGIDCRVVSGSVSGVCAFNFPADSQVTLATTADAGQQFAAWGGACAGQAAGGTCVLTMAAPRSASAQFVALRRVTITSRGDDGRGRVLGAYGIDCRVTGAAVSGGCVADVPDGTPIVLTALPDDGSASTVAQVFAGWAGACASAVNAACSLTPTSSATVSAGFHDGRTLTVQLDGNGGGRVTSSNGLVCDRSANTNTGVCAVTVPYGTTMTMLPTADAASELAAWGGACVGQGTAECTVDLSQSRTVSATFSRRRVTLTLRLVGSGEGSITINGATACARTAAQQGVVECVRQYDVGTTVTITPLPGTQTDFAGYTGDCNGVGLCQLVMNAARTVTGEFAARPGLLLSVESRGASGSGVVRSTEAVPLIDCTITNGVASGGRCTAIVPSGTSVTLRATGDVNNALAFWGAACNGRTTFECTVTMDVPLTVSAGFVAGVDVEMRLLGTARGTVTFEPQGSPSQAPCSVTTAGVPVSCRFSLPSTAPGGVFRATPTSGATFVGFVGPCAESSGADPVPVCTYRGIGFLRVITATFNN